MGAQQLAQDIQYSLRQMRRSPFVVLVAIVTLALGIGTNTALFSILDPLILQKLPVQRPEELVRLDAAGTLGNVGAWEFFSYERLRDNTTGFSGVMAFAGPTVLENSVHDGRSNSPRAEIISENYFSVLGLRPFLGRLTLDSIDLGNTTILGFDYWRHEFAGDVSALGKTIVVHGKALTIIGITPPEYFGMKVGEETDMYIPLSPGVSLGGEGGPTLNWVIAIGRLETGISLEQARITTEPVLREIRKESQIPETDQRQEMDHMVLTSVARGLSAVRGRFSLPARVLMGVAGLILLIACSNVANLLLAQGSARKREIAVRLAMGAARSRLITQLLTEGALLALFGTVAGLVVARWTNQIIVGSLSDIQTHVVLQTPLNGRVLLVSLACAAVAVVLCGMAPAFATTRLDISQDIKLSGANQRAGSTLRLSSVLVIGQVAMSVTALVTAGMLLHSLINLETMDVGFDRDHIIALDISGDGSRTREEVRTFNDRLLEEARSLPGVGSVARSSFAPVSGRIFGVNIIVDGYVTRPGEEPKAFMNGVTPGYLSTLGIELLQGRDFSTQDSPATSRVAIINRSLARHYFAGQNPVGKTLVLSEGNRTAMEIIGVVADSKYLDLRENTTDFIYVDMQQSNLTTISGTLSVRAAGNIAALRTELPKLVHSLDPSVRTTRLATLQERIDESLHVDRLIAALGGIFSLVALLLTGIGLYGVLAFNVTKRTGEIGIRLALGAKRADIFRLVVGHGLKLVLVGLFIGSMAALALTGLLRSILFGVGSRDPLTFAGIFLLMTAASALACYLPARRATRVDPLVVLRND